MSSSYIDQLKSPDPDERKQAILALGRLKDPAALKPLAEVYRSDPDPALRELALKAGRHIRLQTNAQKAAAEKPKGMTAAPTDLAPTPGQVKKARLFFDQALEHHIRHQHAQAIEALGKALEINPTLRSDTMTTNLAMELTGMAHSTALDMLPDPVARREFIETTYGVTIGGSGKPSDPSDTTAEADWGQALIDVGIYGLVNGTIVFVLGVVGFRALMDFIINAMAISGQGALPPGFTDLSSITSASTLPFAALYGLIYAVISMIMLVVLEGAVHLVATTILGGEGTLPGLLRKTTLFFTVLVPVSTLVGILPTLAFSQNETLTPLASILSLIFSLGTAMWAGKLTGEAYRFGMGKGCVSMVLGGIVLGLAFFCCILTLSFTLAQAFGGVATAGF